MTQGKNLASSYKKYGTFNSDGSEFVITRADTPKPWLNYSWSSELLVEIDQRGRGQTTYRNATGQRTNLIKDRIVYVRDQGSGEFWTIGWDPVQLDLFHYTARQGLGYTTLEMRRNGIESTLTILCATDAPVELWKIIVKNISDQPRTIKVYPYAEFDLSGFDVYGGLENATRTRIAKEDQTIYAINNCRSRLGTKNNCFMAGSNGATGFQTSKERFIGSRYGSLTLPAAVRDGELGTFVTANEPLVGVMEYPIDLSPGQEKTIYIAIGPFENESEVSTLAKRYLADGVFEREFETHRQCRSIFQNVDIEVPDDYLTPFLNVWTKQQVMMLMDYSRGWTMGYRDTLQDAQAFCSLDPTKAKKLMILAAKHQLANGQTLRGYWPLDEHKYSDGGVWLTFAVIEYLRETGDFEFLKEKFPYYDSGEGTLYEHMIRGLEWIYQKPGAHGLTRVFFGDWNDSLNIGLKGEGESVWLSIAMVWACKELITLAKRLQDSQTIERFERMASELTSHIEKHCWDGEWYLRGFDDSHQKVGSHECRFGKIFAETQTWSILSGLAKDRAVTVEASLMKHLMTEYGLLVCSPAFSEYDPSLGRITTMPPGWGENGSAYCHVSAFKMMADCVRRDGDAALDTLTRILAINPRADIDVSKVEPYGYTNMYRGPEHPQAGQSLRSWFTGTPGWIFRTVTQRMIGVRPDYDGLWIDPVLPADWPKVRMVRKFRQARYEIIIRRSSSPENNILKMSIDGQPTDTNFIPYEKFTGCHCVEVLWVPNIPFGDKKT
jgi:cellobiose phosphorylase